MTKNPLYNALTAVAYIIAIVLLINFGSQLATQNPQDNILMPIGMLSLFVLSASVMGYLFLYQPILMIVDGKQKEAVGLFLRTVATFAGITLCIFIASFAIVFFQTQ